MNSTSPPTRSKNTDAIVITEAEYVASAARYSQLPAHFANEVAFAGRSNVGKSSLMNTLVDRKNLVRTSSTPGCTRTLNLFRITYRSGKDKTSPSTTLGLMDLPGYGFAQRAKNEKASWGKLIEDYLERREAISLVHLLVDARRGIEEDDFMLFDYLADLDIPIQIVFTKIDKIKKHEQQLLIKSLGPDVKSVLMQKPIFFSAITKEGKGELWQGIKKHGKLQDEQMKEQSHLAKEVTSG